MQQMNESAMAMTRPPRIAEADGPRSAISDWKVTRIQIAEDSRGRPIFWRPADGQMLIVGEPASGKTMTLQNAATQFTREHWAVHIATSSAAEYHEFEDWPNVCCVAATTREHTALIHHLFTLMRIRQTNRDEQYAPVVLIIDSLAEVMGALADADSASVDEIELLVGLGREVGMHIVAAAGMTVDSSGWSSDAPVSMWGLFLERLVLRSPHGGCRMNRSLLELQPSRRSYPKIHLNELTADRDESPTRHPSRRWFRIRAWINRLRRRSQQPSSKGDQHG